MAILNRRGNSIDFDPNKMLAGEFAYCLDTEELFYCYGIGNVKKLATAEDLQEMLDTSETAYNAYLALVSELETSGTVSSILTSISSLQAQNGTASLNTTAQTITEAINELEASSGGSSDSSASTVTFTQATTLANIVTGETHATLFGKIKKFFTFIGTTALTTTSQTVTGAVNELKDGKVNSTLIGAVNGIAQLDSGGVVPASQLPSYVDDVLEYATLSVFPTTGETGKIYVDIATNLTYRWSGSVYVAIGAAGSGNASSISYDNTESELDATEVQSAIDELTNSLNGIKATTLWTNPNPTSPFLAQAIPLSDTINNYKYYEIIYIGISGQANAYSTGKLPISNITRLNVVSAQFIYREVTAVSGTSITFALAKAYASYSGGESTNATTAVPLEIIGYK